MPQFESALPGDFSGKGPLEQGSVPKIVGGFNIPKAVVENKVDVLTFLELLVRKGLTTPQEIDEIREIVVQYLNALYPELNLSYTSPPPPSEVMGLGQAGSAQKSTRPLPAPPPLSTLNIAPPLPQAAPRRPAPPRPVPPKPATGTRPQSGSLFADVLPPELRDKLKED